MSLEAVATQWAADEHVNQARTEARIDAMHAAAAEAPAPAANSSKPLDPELAHLAGALWFAADKVLTRYIGDAYALKPDELEKLSSATGPVLQKYLPAGLGALVATPEGALALTVLTIYGGKLAAGAMGAGTPASSSPPATTTEATA